VDFVLAFFKDFLEGELKALNVEGVTTATSNFVYHFDHVTYLSLPQDAVFLDAGVCATFSRCQIMGGSSGRVSRAKKDKASLVLSTSEQHQAHTSFLVSVTLVLPRDLNLDQVRDPTERRGLKSSVNPFASILCGVYQFLVELQADGLE